MKKRKHTGVAIGLIYLAFDLFLFLLIFHRKVEFYSRAHIFGELNKNFNQIATSTFIALMGQL